MLFSFGSICYNMLKFKFKLMEIVLAATIPITNNSIPTTITSISATNLIFEAESPLFWFMLFTLRNGSSIGCDSWK